MKKISWFLLFAVVGIQNTFAQNESDIQIGKLACEHISNVHHFLQRRLGSSHETVCDVDLWIKENCREIKGREPLRSTNSLYRSIEGVALYGLMPEVRKRDFTRGQIGSLVSMNMLLLSPDPIVEKQKRIKVCKALGSLVEEIVFSDFDQCNCSMRSLIKKNEDLCERGFSDKNYRNLMNTLNDLEYRKFSLEFRKRIRDGVSQVFESIRGW